MGGDSETRGRLFAGPSVSSQMVVLPVVDASGGGGSSGNDDGGGGVPVVLLTAAAAATSSSPDRVLRFFSGSDRRPSGWYGSTNGSCGWCWSGWWESLWWE